MHDAVRCAGRKTWELWRRVEVRSQLPLFWWERMLLIIFAWSIEDTAQLLYRYDDSITAYAGANHRRKLTSIYHHHLFTYHVVRLVSIEIHLFCLHSCASTVPLATPSHSYQSQLL